MPEITDLDENSLLFGAPLSSLHLQEDEEIEEGENEELEGGEDEEEEQETNLPVTLGFVEKPKDLNSLLRHFFPSKAGGAPAWLDPINLPDGNSTLCGFCGVPLQLLIQVYAPISDKESTFHRSLFVFMCTSMECLRKDQAEQRRGDAGIQSRRSVKVFRCQLPRANPFYSSEPPRYDGKDAPLGGGATLCCWCITWKGEKVCSACRKAHYCSEKHQVLHWRAGHKNECHQISTASQASALDDTQAKISPRNANKAASSSLWREYEIINDEESTYDEVDKKEENYESSLVTIGNTAEHLKSLLDKFEGDEDKKHWASFQERIARAPDQVIRYCRNVKAEALWPGISGQPSKADIPSCSFCHGPRCFEFEVLSQLLYYFQVSNNAYSLDWATIAVYTCAASCEAKTGYSDEFAWVQLCS